MVATHELTESATNSITQKLPGKQKTLNRIFTFHITDIVYDGAKVCTPVTKDIAAISELVQSGTSGTYRTRESSPWPKQGAIIEHSCRHRRRSNRIIK